jgi:hypothetical protein
MPAFKNDASLNAFLTMVMSDVINSVTEELIEELQLEILETVYDPVSPSVYERQKFNGGLVNSWVQHQTVAGNVIENKIEEDSDLLTHDPGNFIHGSYYYFLGDDIRGALAEIINEGKSGDLFGEGFWRSPRPFFDNFIEKVNNGLVDEKLEKHFRIRGIKYVKI